MTNSVSIEYPSGSDAVFQVSYAIEQIDNLQTINCCVDGTRFPVWLQLRKFSLSSLKRPGGYTPLYNEINNSKNMDTGLFIDMVYTSIMHEERMKVYN